MRQETQKPGYASKYLLLTQQVAPVTTPRGNIVVKSVNSCEEIYRFFLLEKTLVPLEQIRFTSSTESKVMELAELFVCDY